MPTLDALSIHDLEAMRVKIAVGLAIEPNPHRRTHWEKRLVSTWSDGANEWALIDGLCKGCRRPIDTTPTCGIVCGESIEFPSTVCDDCMELVRAHYDPSRKPDEDNVTMTPEWDKKCPQRHKEVAIGAVKPAGIDWAAFEKVAAWKAEERRGIICTGAPGTGKTSAFWALAKALEEAGTAPVVLGSLELGRVLSEAARDIREVGWLHGCKVLMIDDLGKERATPAAAALFWEVLDRRLSNGKPLICTTNFAGAEFADRFGEKHLGDAIRRRLSELCRRVHFNPH